jgi:hypothetical protein
MVFGKVHWCIAIAVLSALMVIGCEVVFLKALDPAGHLPLDILEAEQPGQGRWSLYRWNSCL